MALRTSTAVVLAVCVLAALVAIAAVAATQTRSISVKHLGHVATIAVTGDKAATESVVVASNGAASARAAKAATPVRPWRETLHWRALVLIRSAPLPWRAPPARGSDGSGQRSSVRRYPDTAASPPSSTSRALAYPRRNACSSPKAAPGMTKAPLKSNSPWQNSVDGRSWS